MPEKVRLNEPIPRWMKGLIVGVPAANLADVLTTRRALASGGKEANPLMGNQSAAYALKAGVSLATMLTAVKLWKKGHKKAAAGSALIGIAIPATAAAWNMSQIKKGR